MKATWNGTLLAESDETIVVEGNHYFPSESVRSRYLQPSRKRSICGWKGFASYYTVADGSQKSPDAAWTYQRPFPWIRKIRGHVAFSREAVNVRE